MMADRPCRHCGHVFRREHSFGPDRTTCPACGCPGAPPLDATRAKEPTGVTITAADLDAADRRRLGRRLLIVLTLAIELGAAAWGAVTSRRRRA